MITRSYKCSLESDIILNQSLATAGNVSTLDYIPGSVFMGIVARSVYENHKEDAYNILHSNKVKFGDATISAEGGHSYHLPFSLRRPKILSQSNNYVYYLLNKDNWPIIDNRKIQLNQVREDYFLPDKNLELSVKKRFTIKSARDKTTRKSKDAQMFGYESIRAGQTFTFSISYDEKRFEDIVEGALLGEKRVGKSRTAEYSLARIEKIETIQHDYAENPDYTLIFANSNLCFFDANGQPTFNPNPEQLGVKGKIDWEKSQVRTYSYTSWNGFRNSPNAQRFCIARGSVFYVSGKNTGKEEFVGAYQTEGLGHILINPKFLFEVDESKGIWNFMLKSKIEEKPNSKSIESRLGKYLDRKKKEKIDERKLSEDIQKTINSVGSEFPGVTSSQWGKIRTYATNADKEKLEYILFDDKTGYLIDGVAYDRYWNRNGNLSRLKTLIEGKSSTFVAKFAAEMAKNQNKTQ